MLSECTFTQNAKLTQLPSACWVVQPLHPSEPVSLGRMWGCVWGYLRPSLSIILGPGNLRTALRGKKGGGRSRALPAQDRAAGPSCTMSFQPPVRVGCWRARPFPSLTLAFTSVTSKWTEVLPFPCILQGPSDFRASLLGSGQEKRQE